MDAGAGKKNSAAVSSTNGNRATLACLQCKKRKRRCDGAKPSCGLCAGNRSICIYTERRRRGPGKRKDHIKFLEERMSKLESRLHEQSAPLSISGEEIDGSGELGNSSTAPEGLQDEFPGFIAKPINVSLDEQPPGPSDSGSPTKSDDAPGVHADAMKQAESLLGRELALKFTESVADIRTTAQQLRANVDMTCFHRRVFARLPTQHHIIELMLPVVEQIQPHGILFKTKSFLHLLDQQLIAGPDNCADDSSRWATVNTFFAKSILHRTSNESISGMSSTAWGFFKNAFAMFPELMIQGEELPACEAMLAMSMFMLGSGDARTTSQLTAAAARLVHGIGLHRKDHYPTLDTEVAERHRQVFWVAYVLNTEVMHRYGLPSPFRDDAIAVDLPQDDALRHVAALAIIQSQIYGLLHSNISAHTSSGGPLDAIAATSQDLQIWKSTLPEQMQPRNKYSAEVLDIPLATLHYKFFSCAAKIHMTTARLMSPKLFESTKDIHLGIKDMSRSAELTRNLCAASARSTLNVLRCLAPHPICQLWETLCYPLSAVLILLLAILADPTGELAESDVELIGEFVQFLERLQKHGCDVDSLLDGCIKFHWVALCAINASEVGQHLWDWDQGVAEGITWAQLQSIRLKLSKVTDWLQLAQGLLSNISRLRMESEEVLSDIFGTQPTSGVYGRFVPEFLKSCSYNLSFGN